MGTDKSMLQYHSKPQRYYVFDLLKPLCSQVLISIKEDRYSEADLSYPTLHDYKKYKDIGPMAALMTAIYNFPGSNFICIGCDYPFLNQETLFRFAANCKKNKPTAFYNEEESIYEPILAWYPNACIAEMTKRFEAGKYSLRHFLEETGADKFVPKDKDILFSADTPEEFQKAMKKLNGYYPEP